MALCINIPRCVSDCALLFSPWCCKSTALLIDAAAAQISTMASRWEQGDDKPSDGGRYVQRQFTVPVKNAARDEPGQGKDQNQRVIALDTDPDSTEEEEEVIEANIGHARDPSHSLPPHPSHSRAVSDRSKDSISYRHNGDGRHGRHGREDKGKGRDQPSRPYTHVSTFNQPLAGRDTLVDGQLTTLYKQRPHLESLSISYPSSGSRRSYSRDSHSRHTHGPHYRGHKHRHERRHSNHDALAWDDTGDNQDSSSLLGLSSWLRRIGIFDDDNGDVGKHDSQSNTTGSSSSSRVRRHRRQHDTSRIQSRWEDDDGGDGGDGDDGDDGDQWELPSRSHRRYHGSSNSSSYHTRASSPYADRPSHGSRLPSTNKAIRRHDGDDNDDDDNGWDDDYTRPHRQSTRTRSVRSRSRRGYSVDLQGPDREDKGHKDHTQRQERKSTISAAAKHAMKAGAMAALSNAAVPGDWLGEKGSRVATAALGAALVDTFMSQNYPKRVNGIRHTAMRQVAERTIKSMVTEPIFQRAAQHRGNRGHDRPSY
ncbi:hypothetical protein F503_05856 [Ophiostoma piceae UAMH 11346]|uniref:Uncharacterized protein n=1 Tax=Ophiostoma piceae (strain UAMH 11346) TaxID=1262450 RepID=S3CF87_OPHP1|nr:hypothetical protein F503_05856 [Ophiostoma piceae UAMH 11346]